MRLARGRSEVFLVRNFDIECVSDQVRTDLDGKIWVVVDMLAEQSAARRQVEHEGVNRPCVFTRRRRLGVIHAAGSSSVTTELALGRSGAGACTMCMCSRCTARPRQQAWIGSRLSRSQSLARTSCLGPRGRQTYHMDGSCVSFRVMDDQKGCARLSRISCVLRGG